MRIGTPIFNWQDCGTCIWFKEGDGCKYDGQPEIMVDEGECAIICLTGTTAPEPDYELDIDFVDPWE